MSIPTARTHLILRSCRKASRKRTKSEGASDLLLMAGPQQSIGDMQRAGPFNKCGAEKLKWSERVQRRESLKTWGNNVNHAGTLSRRRCSTWTARGAVAWLPGEHRGTKQVAAGGR